LLFACVAVAVLPAAGSAQPANPQANAASSFEFPQRREVEGYSLLIHAPQIRTWPEFKRFEADVAFELTPPGATKPHLGTAQVTGTTTVDLAKRLVIVHSPVVDKVKFSGQVSSGESAVVQRGVRKGELDVPVDLFLSYLAEDVLAGPPATGFNTAAPPIVVRSTPTILLHVNGKPVPSAIPGTGLERIINSNWPVLHETGAKTAYYLLDRDRWLVSPKLESGWKAATSLPADFAKLPTGDEYATIRQAVPLKASTQPVPAVLYADRPTELIETTGRPTLEAIPGTGGLQWVTNTDSPLFKLESRWYFLVAGRWFATAKLEAGPWTLVTELPQSFSAIPEDHPRAAVRASVPGTVDARMAALEASLPVTTEVKAGSAPPVEVTYAGEPKFEAIAGTQVARAANTGFDVLHYADRYYLCYSAAWYVADSPKGPWAATADVPAAIYAIPPSSPSFAVTDVKAEESSGDSIEFSSTAAYSTGVFVAMGVAYYGTGWYYPPYYYPPYYYPYWPTYGHGSWYNPATGRYGSRSVWAGPYGGYSYNQAYNPRTGRYGYVETAWDGDEWASHGETYNPRTGVSSKTDRYYDEDKNKATMDRKTERGDEWVKTERTADFDEGKATTERETSRGGSSETVRQGGSSATTIEGGGGGQAISVSGEGPGRATIAQSGSGDLYAGHDGNVYKKTDDGWQQYQGGQWSPAEVPQRPEGSASTPRPMPSQQPMPSREIDNAQSYSSRPAYGASREMNPSPGSYDRPSYGSSGLDRDYAARQRGAMQYQQRMGGGRVGRRGR